MSQAISRAWLNDEARSFDSLPRDPRLLELQSRCDQDVARSLLAYRHAGGSIIDHSLPLPAELNQRPPPELALRAMLALKGLPDGAARVDPEKRECLFDGRYKIEVVGLFSRYAQVPESFLIPKPLPKDRWHLKAFSDDAEAESYLAARGRGAGPGSSPSPA